MPAAERERSAAALPARNAQELGAGLLWLVMPAAWLTTVVLCLDLSAAWSLPRLAFCGCMGLVALCLSLSLVSQRRFWWAPRIVAGLLGFGWLAAVYLVAWYPPELARDPRFPVVFIATTGFLVMGVSALCFMLWGHTGGKLARPDALHITLMDRWTARLLVLLRYALYIALSFYLLRLLYLEALLYPG